MSKHSFHLFRHLGVCPQCHYNHKPSERQQMSLSLASGVFPTSGETQCSMHSHHKSLPIKSFRITIKTSFICRLATSSQNCSFATLSTTNPPSQRPQVCLNRDTMDWSSGEKSGRVSIDSHSLFLFTSGPDRQPGEPAAIIIQGLANSSRGWAAVQRLLRPIIRTYLYDRSGYGLSDPSPQKPTSAAIVAELDQLLRKADISGPFLLVAHSWGGILSREFIHLRPADVLGLVLVDANQESTLEVLDWRHPALWAVAGGVDHLEETGVRRNHKLRAEEWAAFLADEASAKHRKQAEAEHLEYAASFPLLGEKWQLFRDPPLLGDCPVCVVLGNTKRDFVGLYEAGVKAGFGSEEERAVCRELFETWVERDRQLLLQPLSLSRNGRSLVARESGHSVHLTNPEVVVEGVKWVLSQLKAGEA